MGVFFLSLGVEASKGPGWPSEVLMLLGRTLLPGEAGLAILPASDVPSQTGLEGSPLCSQSFQPVTPAL